MFGGSECGFIITILLNSFESLYVKFEFFFLFAKSSIFLFINCNIIFIQYADSCFNYHIVFGRKECHCMLFLTPDNDFAGQDQVTP